MSSSHWRVPAALFAFLALGIGASRHADAAPLPDFSLIDVNARSARHGDAVGPEQYRQQVSVWYFGSAT